MRKILDGINRTQPIPAIDLPIGKRLHAGERTSPFTPEQWQTFIGTLTQEDVIFYPDSSRLKKKIASYHAISPENIMIFAGADAALRCIAQTFVDPGSSIIVPEHHFPMYDVYAAQQGATVRLLKYDGAVMTSGLTDGPDPHLMIVANPNSPMGDKPSRSTIDALIATHRVPLAIDAVYSDFGSTPLDLAEYLDKDVLFVHSFSKVWGAAGARVGYVIAKPSFIALLNKMSPMVPVAGMSLRFAEWAMDHPEIKDAYVEEIISIREQINELYPGNRGGNWAELPSIVGERLTAAGFSVKPVKRGSISLVRVTITKDLLDFI